MFKPKTICITGPESTGKSSLVVSLSKRFGVPFVPEFAREFLESKNNSYVEKDLVEIIKGQIEFIKSTIQKNTKTPFIILDTDPITIKIWSLYKYGRIRLDLAKLIDSFRADYYLLCYPDLDWKYDPLRENEDQLGELFVIYENELQDLQLRYGIVSSQNEQRIQNAETLIKMFLD